MHSSVLELFTIGIGPSASHTVAPMRAARLYVERLQAHDLLQCLARLQITLYGSLAFTGKGHGTDKALILGLHGSEPATVEPDYLRQYADAVIASGKLTLLGGVELAFDYKRDLIFNRKQNLHNLMAFNAYDASGKCIDTASYQSTGGGFLAADTHSTKLAPLSFSNAGELLALCAEHGYSIADVALKNELAWSTLAALNAKLDAILVAMRASIANGLARQERTLLPGALRVKRRAPTMYEKLKMQRGANIELNALDWVNMYAIAVNEENASGERVVAAPTNGASGIIPAVVSFLEKFCDIQSIQVADVSRRFLLTAGCIGIIYKTNASLSGAEVGCQGEVGVACSMAAAALTEALGGNADQAEEAAEIAIEHHLGLTCDPVGGLVQIPCIERNAMGAVKAINASRLALQGTGKHVVTLDKAIKTMLETGKDMKSKYKETARGGLAVNIVEC
ncbi:MAG: L-serine ammonia-lyase [Pseudomonadota bacterium]|nr:L-serine ammonia-lyase [Pseudomonadota bacterium]